MADNFGLDILVIFLVTFLTCVFVARRWRESRLLPPGPFGLPLVGYLPWLDPKAPYETLSSLVDSYGRIYSLRLGTVQVIVISDPTLIRKLLSMEETTGRAPLYITHGIMQGYGIICAEGDMWKEHRKFLLSYMRSCGMKGSTYKHDLQQCIAKTADELISVFENCPKEGVDINHYLPHYIGNTMNELIFGVNYSDDNPTWKWLRHLLEEGIKHIGVVGPMNFLPFLRFIPKYKSSMEFLISNKDKTHVVYESLYQERKEKIAEKALCLPESLYQKRKEKIAEKALCLPDQENEKSNLMNEYIKERTSRGDSEGTFTQTQFNHVAADLFGAGTETTVTTLRWHLLDMALYPEVQEKVHQELVEGFKEHGDAAFVDIEGSALFPYTEAALMETQRLRSMIPTGIPHGVLKDINVDGFVIPKGSMLLPLLWRVHRDPLYWKDPLEFNPSRFLDDDGRLLKRHPAFLPFQIGRRVCIGEDFAKMMILTFTSKIFLKFEVTCPEGRNMEDPFKDAVCGLTLIPRPFNLVFKPKNV